MISTRLGITLLVFTHSLFSMQSSKSDLKPITNDVLSHQIQCHVKLFSHDTIRALALVNKCLNKKIEESVIHRKLYLSSQKEYCEILQQHAHLNKQLVWHKYNSAYAYWTQKNAWVDEREEKQITFNLVHLDGTDTIRHHELQCLPTDDCESNLLSNPYFNAKGDACFYAVGQFSLPKGEECGALICPSYRQYIFHYSINSKGIKKQLPCYVKFLTNKNCITNLMSFQYNPTVLDKILDSSLTEESSIESFNDVKIYEKGDNRYYGPIKIYHYDDTVASHDLIKPIPPIEEKPTIKKPEKQNNTQVLEFLKTPNLSKRLTAEINTLLEDERCTIQVNAVNSKTHPFEIKIVFYDDIVERVLTCKLPQNYPFLAPIIFLETQDDQLNTQDLVTINKEFNNELKAIWHPTINIQKMIDETNIKIKSYTDKKIAAQGVAQGRTRTLVHLKEKYQPHNTSSSEKYPEFQQKLQGIWIQEKADGYFVFHVDGDYINMAFEPKYIDAKPLSYRGSYAAGYHQTNKNLFNIHIGNADDLWRTNAFDLTIYPDSLLIQFYQLANDSILAPIIDQLNLNYSHQHISLIKIK